MIRHLNSKGFAAFGTILHDGQILVRKPNHHSVFLPEGAVTEYRTVAPLWLGAETGLTVLSVSENGEDFADFYLDKSVGLKAGIWFRLTGLGGRAAVQMSGVSMPMELGRQINARDFAIHPKLRVECLYTLFYQQKEPGFVFAGEAHPMGELLYVEAGSLHSVADGQDLLLEKGHMVLYGPEQWHMQYADPDQAPRIVTMSFWARGLDWAQFRCRRFAADRDAAVLIQRILLAQEQDDGEQIFSLLTLLLLNLKRQGVREPNLAPGSENAIINRALQCIQAQVSEKLTVPLVAEQVGVSASYLTALFHSHLQISPGEYVRRIKLERSKQLIREGRMNFTQIAQSLQYSTVHHFSRQFKQVFGQTPTEYAASLRQPVTARDGVNI